VIRVKATIPWMQRPNRSQHKIALGHSVRYHMTAPALATQLIALEENRTALEESGQ